MKRKFFVLTVAFTLALAACSGWTVSPIAPTSSPTPIATETHIPTKTAIPTASLWPTSTPSLTLTPTSRPTNTPTTTPTSIVYQPAFGIDYAHPEKYLEQGEQSLISDPSVLVGLRADEQSMVQLGNIYRWLKNAFTSYSAGGKTIGVVTVNQLLKERQLGGCHDYGLVYAAVARELGYPALMARTSSIAWVETFQAGKQGPHIGHVFVEVFLDAKWMLVDSTNGWYVDEGYNPADPVIPLKGPIVGSSEEIYGFYVECKGIDIWTFGIHSPAESIKAMDDFANQLDLESIEYPVYSIHRFQR
jgi:hypothetical protein